jgi:hypothetical protein
MLTNHDVTWLVGFGGALVVLFILSKACEALIKQNIVSTCNKGNNNNNRNDNAYR